MNPHIEQIKDNLKEIKESLNKINEKGIENIVIPHHSHFVDINKTFRLIITSLDIAIGNKQIKYLTRTNNITASL